MQQSVDIIKNARSLLQAIPESKANDKTKAGYLRVMQRIFASVQTSATLARAPDRAVQRLAIASDGACEGCGLFCVGVVERGLLSRLHRRQALLDGAERPAALTLLVVRPAQPATVGGSAAAFEVACGGLLVCYQS